MAPPFQCFTRPGCPGWTGWLAVTVIVAMTAASGWLCTRANAETLKEAMSAAYNTNPSLDAERARLRATDESVPIARSGYRPNINSQMSRTRTSTKTEPAGVSLQEGSLTTSTIEFNLTQPLFTGFQTTNAVNEAEANVRAGRENLRRVESGVLLDAATVFVDVVRDQETLRLRQRNVAVLTEELTAANERRAAREVTLTDVAQARARRARAISAADDAKANLRISRANYRRVIGHAPSRLRRPGVKMKALPRSLRASLDIAEQESPNIVSALYREQAAKYAVDRVWGELLPRVDLEANYGRQFGGSRLIDEEQTASITGRLTIPFYQGGEVHARVRQAKHTHVSRLQEVEQARTETEAEVTAAWSRLVSARAQLSSDHIQVDSARTALEGVREEEKVGQRTLLDVLNAEQELLDAQVSRVATQRDLVVASYSLLSAIGRLRAAEISSIVEVYDPEEHYHDVREKWAGISITRHDAPQFEPTYDDEVPNQPWGLAGSVKDLFRDTLR